MAFSSNIYDLLNTDFDARDLEWESAFLNALPSAQMTLLNEAPQKGPDGWPYLMVKTDPSASESVLKVLDWLSDKGIGLAINPQKNAPDFVLSYGMVWNFKQRKEFLSVVDRSQLGQVKFEPGEKIMAGPPSDDFFPQYAREILRSFFNENHIKEPKILVMSKDQKKFDLCFSLESFGNPDAQEHKGILEAISWFLPAHYSLVVVSEKGLPAFHLL